MVTEALASNNEVQILNKPSESYEVKTAPEDEDSVSIDTNEVGTNPDYEYYYVYYDEQGNIVEKSPPKVIESATLNGNKVQDIPLVSSTTTSTTTKNTLNTNQLGDTPTIYASLGEESSNEENEKSEETETEDEGMSIFGIPIPKIPFPILSFGLAPTTLSHGLLPIGRKGDPSAEADSSESGLNRKTGNGNTPEITRGPDTIDPIWLETLINAGKSYFASSVEEEEEPEETEIDRNFQQYFPNLGYQQPQNPVIPLSSTEEDYQDIPIIITSQGPEYYPQANQYVPAIKFDHPAENGGPIKYPIRPAPDLQPHQYPAGPAAEDGFIPLFLPDKSDPIRTTQPSAFPGIDSTLQLPAEGYKLPLYPQQQRPALNFEYPLIYKKPPQQLPDSEIPIVYANNPTSVEVQNSGESEVPQELPEYPAVPLEIVPKKREYPIFKDKTSTELPIIKRATKTPPTTTTPPNLPDYEYYYVYEDEDTPDYQNSPAQEILKSLSISTTTTEKVTTEESTTERKVPTLEVEEILPSRIPIKSTTTTEVPKVSSTPASTPRPNEVEYEYEYYYEYYEDPKDTQNQTEVKAIYPEVPEVPQDSDLSTDSTETNFNLQKFLNFITTNKKNQVPPSTTEVTISTAGTKGTIPKKPLLLPNSSKPTPAVPIRTSTELYDNFLESQRSTVTVETTNPRRHENHRNFGRSTTSSNTPQSTPYPFRPDRLDPRGPQPHNNEVKWYYSNYNSEGLEPYIDPRIPREEDEAAHVQPSKASINTLSVFCIFLIPYFVL